MNRKIKILASDIIKIKQFVEDSFSTSTDEYARRNQNNIEKIKKDIYNGKLAEFGVYYILKDKFTVNEPDLKIYNAGGKSFDADLSFLNKKGSKIELHIKSQHITSVNSFGKSWSFHPTDSLTTSPTESDVIVLCVVYDSETVEILKKVKAIDIVGKYGEPTVPRLKGKKKVLYWETVEKI